MAEFNETIVTTMDRYWNTLRDLIDRVNETGDDSLKNEAIRFAYDKLGYREKMIDDLYDSWKQDSIDEDNKRWNQLADKVKLHFSINQDYDYNYDDESENEEEFVGGLF